MGVPPTAALMMPTGTRQLLMQLAGEEIANRGKAGRGSAASKPAHAASSIRRGFSRRAGQSVDAINVVMDEHPDLRIVRRRDFFLGAIHLPMQPADLHFHVRLPRAQPHFAHQHIADCQRVLSGDSAFAVRPSLAWAQLDHPFAVCAGLGGLRFSGQRDRNLLARLGPAPDRHHHLGLYDHVVGKNRRQPDIGLRGRGQRRVKKREAKKPQSVRSSIAAA